MQPSNPLFYTKNYLPSKKIIYIITAIVVTALSFWVIPKIRSYYQTHRASFSINGKPPEPLIASTPTPSNLDKDSDGDKIPDWQENLFGFDPNKKDSDADGVEDTLPTVGGVSIGAQINIPDSDKLILAVYSKFQNVPTDEIKPEEVQQVISDEILANAASVEAAFKRYRTVDLELTDDTKESINTYQKKIEDIVTTTTDLVILVKNIQEKILNDTDATVELNTLNLTITKLLATPVPTTLSAVHLSIINAAYFIIQNIQIPSNKDELTIYTKSLIAQKNINIVQQAMVDIITLTQIYNTN